MAEALPTTETDQAPPGFDRGLFESVRTLARVADEMGRQPARVDHVTGLPTRLRFLDDFAGEAAAGKRSLVLVTLADARHFNELLRALGHAYSEDFIRAGAERLAAVLPRDTILYHVSVLSFAFFWTEPPSTAPMPLVREIVEAFRPSITCQDIPVDTRVGVGITRVGEDTASAGELLRATLAAAQDSRRGFDGWALYDRRSDEAQMRAFRILTDLPAAFAADDQLTLHYQPRIVLRDGSCAGAEALIRWTHPTLGPVSPGEFVTLAESTALITPLTQWVIRNGLQAAARWRRGRRDLRMSLNISPRNLEEPHFADFLLHETDRAGLDPSAIELEFTEGALAANPHLMLGQLSLLRDSGFDIAIDDFGSGYSNMSNLGRLPARVLKIDRSFVQTLHTEHRNQILVRSIIELAHALDYQVVAEGVETEEAYRMLAGWRCDEGQGYFMSRPLAEPAMMDWVDARVGSNGFGNA
jgi:EAL domain-containing protein (putative c-di-GMP-specific phosphodiesterase class I)/GGDEF domain-containing protein